MTAIFVAFWVSDRPVGVYRQPQVTEALANCPAVFFQFLTWAFDMKHSWQKIKLSKTRSSKEGWMYHQIKQSTTEAPPCSGRTGHPVPWSASQVRWIWTVIWGEEVKQESDFVAFFLLETCKCWCPWSGPSVRGRWSEEGGFWSGKAPRCHPWAPLKEAQMRSSLK